MFNELLAEVLAVKAAAVPTDMNGAAISGAVIKMNHGHSVGILLHFGDSTAANVVVSLKQYQDGGVNGKALTINHPIYSKVAAETSFTLEADGNLSDRLAADEGIVILEVMANDLDLANNYSEISVELEDSTAAKIVSAQYLVDTRQKPAHAEVIA